VAIPSLSKAMQKAGGKIFPFGFLYLMRAMKNAKVADLMLTGIVPEMQGAGVPALLITELQKVMIQHGIKYVETTGIFETNHKAIKHWKNYEHIQHKRRRCFVKAIS
jgi:limonene-1,2-epoxide hydrolase